MNPALLLFCLPLLAAMNGTGTAGKPGFLEPDKPVASRTLHLCYDPGAAAARFTVRDEVYGVAVFITARGVDRMAVRLGPGAAGDLRGAVDVPPDASYLRCDFVTRADCDRGASVSVMVYDAAGNPMRGARACGALEAGPRYAEVVQDELAHFPEQHAAYRTKWFAAQMFVDRAALLDMVRADLAELDGQTSAGALWARSYGLLVLGDEPAARALVLRALAEYPTDWSTARAVSDYEYKTYEQSITGEGPQSVARRKAEVIAAHPEGEFAREEIRVVSASPDFPLADTEAVCEAWLRAEPAHPEPAYVLARAYLQHREKLDRAAALIRQAATGYLGGELRLLGDSGGQITKFMLPSVYRTAAEIALLQRDWGTALASARAAQALETRTHAGGHELEARLWQALGHREQAELAWARALNAGSKTALAQLRQLFEDERGQSAGFDAHVAELTRKVDDGARPVAPGFSVRDLGDRAIDLAELRGRVVVLNFWGLGCAPCKVEIPHLSELADSYRGQPVDFVAFATDGADALRDYLAEHAFSYRIVASAGQVAARYAVQSWPTHVVIDKQGRIAATLVGGGVGQDERLRPLIDRVLRE